MNEDKLYNLSDDELEKEVSQIRDNENNTEDNNEDDNEEIDNNDNSEKESDTEDTSLKDNFYTHNTQENDTSMQTDNTTSSVSSNYYKIKADGVEYDFTLDELQKLAPKAMNYTKKMQSIAPYRKMISAMEENSISQDDINTLIDMKKGNKEAVANFMKSNNIDYYDINPDDESEYTPNDYGKSPEYIELNEIVNEISNDQEYTKTQKILTDVLDDTSKKIMIDNPSLVRELHIDVKNGTYDKVMPIAHKLAVMDDNKKSTLDYYIMAGQQYLKNLGNIGGTNKANNTSAKRSATLPRTGKGATDYLNEEEDDKAYQEWYANLQKSY